MHSRQTNRAKSQNPARKAGRLLYCLWMLPFATCAHRVQVDSLPQDAIVYALDGKGGRKGQLGRTPLVLEDYSQQDLSGLEVELAGFLPHKMMVPFNAGSDVKVRVDLQKLSDEWIAQLPPRVLRASIDKIMADMLDLQSSLYVKSEEDVKKKLEEASKKYSDLSMFHYLVGNHNFYKNSYAEASAAYSRALALDPKNEDARRMLVLTDVKFVSNSYAARSKAFATLEAAARDVASLGDGYFAKTKSNPNLPDSDGFEIIIPTDSLFKPSTSRLTPKAFAILAKLSQEFLKTQQGLAISIDGHTDSDPAGEAQSAPGFLIKSKPMFSSLWELSSGRAVAVMEYFKAEGVTAEAWSIAGYADSRPMFINKKNPKEQAVTVADQKLNRRIVIRVSTLSRSRRELTLTEEEAAKAQSRLKEFTESEEEREANEKAARKRNPRGTGGNNNNNNGNNGSNGGENGKANSLKPDSQGAPTSGSTSKPTQQQQQQQQGEGGQQSDSSTFRLPPAGRKITSEKPDGSGLQGGVSGDSGSAATAPMGDKGNVPPIGGAGAPALNQQGDKNGGTQAPQKSDLPRSLPRKTRLQQLQGTEQKQPAGRGTRPQRQSEPKPNVGGASGQDPSGIAPRPKVPKISL